MSYQEGIIFGVLIREIGMSKNKRLVEDKGQYQKKQDVRLRLLGGQQVLCAAFSGLPKLPPR